MSSPTLTSRPQTEKKYSWESYCLAALLSSNIAPRSNHAIIQGPNVSGVQVTFSGIQMWRAGATQAEVRTATYPNRNLSNSAMEHKSWDAILYTGHPDWSRVNALIRSDVRLLPKHGLLTWCADMQHNWQQAEPLRTCERIFSKCSMRLSFSFWLSVNLARVSDRESCVSRSVSISLSLSSNMFTINCSKFVSSFWP